MDWARKWPRFWRGSPSRPAIGSTEVRLPSSISPRQILLAVAALPLVGQVGEDVTGEFGELGVERLDGVGVHIATMRPNVMAYPAAPLN